MNDLEPPSRRLRVVLAITELEAGGAERCCVDLARGLDRTRFDPIVYSIAPPPSEPQRSLVPSLEDAGVAVRFLNGGATRSAPMVLWRFAKFLRQDRPDVLQTFLYHANILGRIAGKLAGTPHVFSGVRVAEHRGRWRLNVDRWTQCCVERQVCVSQSVADFMRERAGLSAEKLTVIPNGVDAERFATAPPADLTKFGVIAGVPVVTFVGRLDEQKGLVEFLKEWVLRSSGLPNHQLLLAGAGPQEDELRRLVNRADAQSRVCFAGWQDDIAGILKSSDLFAFPSRWEGMPNVVLEAMAAGLPIATYEIEGARELLGDLSDDQIAPRGDAEALFRKIENFVRQPDFGRTIGAANAVRANEKFSKRAMIDAYANLFESATRGG